MEEELRFLVNVRLYNYDDVYMGGSSFVRPHAWILNFAYANLYP